MRWRIPIELHSDNRTQSSSIEFADFCKSWDIQHITSSPHYPQSNGAVEWAFGTAKHILHQHDSQLAVLSYRATQIAATGASPCSANPGIPTLLVLESNLQPCHFSPQQFAGKDKKS